MGLKARLCWKTETNYHVSRGGGERLGEQQKAQSLGENVVCF